MLRGEAEGTGEWATCPSRGQGLRDAPQLPLTPEQGWGGAGWAPGAQSRLVPSSSPVGSLLLESLPLGRAPPSTAGTKEEGQQEGINTEKVPGERRYCAVPCPPPWRLPEESPDHASLGRHLHGPQGLLHFCICSRSRVAQGLEPRFSRAPPCAVPGLAPQGPAIRTRRVQSMGSFPPEPSPVPFRTRPRDGEGTVPAREGAAGNLPALADPSGLHKRAQPRRHQDILALGSR